MTLNEWLVWRFDDPETKLAWYSDTDAPEWDITDAETVSYLTQTFEQSDTLLRPFSDAQVTEGLHAIISPALSDDAFTLVDEGVPLPERLRCIRTMASLYEKCFALRCSPHLSALDEPGANPLNGVCYMWWDVIPIGGQTYSHPERAERQAIDSACLDVMRQALQIDQDACRESAIHGLNHYKRYLPEAGAILDDFLSRRPNVRPELIEYALLARYSNVQ